MSAGVIDLLEAVKIAQDNPTKEVVFFAVGFETTAPANAMAVWQADHDGVENFSILVSHVLVPPAMEALLSSEQCVVQGFLAAGHVCTVMGFEEYFPIAEKYKVPIVVTGFEPLDLLEGIHMTVSQLEEGRHGVENQYTRAVRREGNRPAQTTISGPIAGPPLGGVLSAAAVPHRISLRYLRFAITQKNLRQQIVPSPLPFRIEGFPLSQLRISVLILDPTHPSIQRQ